MRHSHAKIRKIQGAEPLYHTDEEIILLPSLYQYILSADEVLLSGAVLVVSELIFIEADATALYQLAELALARKKSALAHQQVEDTQTTIYLILSDFGLGHALEYGEECLLIYSPQRLMGCAPEEYLGCLHRHLIVLTGVYEYGQLLCQLALEHTDMGGLVMLCFECFDLRPGEHREYADELLRILVRDIEPKLIELVGCRISAVKPYIAALGLAILS